MRIRGFWSLARGSFSAALCAGILVAGFGAGHAALNYRIKPGAFTPTAKNMRLFWGGAARQLHGRLHSDKTLLQLASPRALQVLETAQEGQNLAFYEYLPAKYRRRPWLFLDLQPQAQLELIERGIQAASNGLAKKAPGILREAERMARDFRPTNAWADRFSRDLADVYSNIGALENNPAYLSEPLRAQVQAVRSPEFGKPVPWRPVLARSKPAIEKVWYAKSVAPEPRAVFEESLRRRKSPWLSELKRMGIDMKSSVAPRLKVKGAEARGTQGDLAFAVEWQQGKRHAGAFRAVVSAEDAVPKLHELKAPKPPLDKQLVLRFRKDATGEEIERFLEESGIRVLKKEWEGDYLVSVTGRQSARDLARAITGQKPVLYASAMTPAIPESRQLRLAIRMHWAAPGQEPRPTSEGDVSSILNIPGARVLKHEPNDAHFSYIVGVTGRSLASFLADWRLSHRALFHAAPLQIRAPEEKQWILRFRRRPLTPGSAELAGWEDRIKELVSAQGLRVLEQIGLHAFRVASGKPLPLDAGRLKEDSIVDSVVRVGSVSDERIETAIRSVQDSSRGYKKKGSEFGEDNFHFREALELEGATRAQLARFDAAAQEADRRGEFSGTAPRR